MADLQRKTANLFDETYTGLTTSLTYFPIYVGDGNFTLSTTTPNNPTGASLFFLRGQAASGASSSANGVWEGQSRTVTALNGYITIAYRYNDGVYVNPQNYNTMLNSGSTAKPYEPYGWVHSLRKLTTATEAVENPLYSDGTAITAYTLKGNTVQSGTPSPSNPVMPNGVGERTENLFDYSDLEDGTLSNGEPVPYTGHKRTAHFIKVDTSTTYRLSNLSSSERVSYYDSTKTYISNALIDNVFTTPSNCEYVKFSGAATGWAQTTMLTKGSTAPTSYIPYGYEIGISSPVVTTNIDLGSTQTVRQVKKFILTGDDGGTWIVNSAITSGNAYFNRDIFTGYKSNVLSGYCTHYPTATAITDTIGVLFGTNLNFITAFSEGLDTVDKWYNYLRQQYAAGTPVTVWYVLETPQTAVVNEPLMKIGDYADTLSNAVSIPTNEGANSITVDTTVQPSEFTATWTGWHDASVKEKSKNLFNTFDIVGQVPSISNGQLVNYNGSTTSLIPIISGNITVTKPPTAWLYLLLYAADMSYIGYVQNSTDANFYGSSVTGYENAKYCRLRIDRTTGLDDIQIMLNTGSTALPYEPYWK